MRMNDSSRMQETTRIQNNHPASSNPHEIGLREKYKFHFFCQKLGRRRKRKEEDIQKTKLGWNLTFEHVARSCTGDWWQQLVVTVGGNLTSAYFYPNHRISDKLFLANLGCSWSHLTDLFTGRLLWHRICGWYFEILFKYDCRIRIANKITQQYEFCFRGTIRHSCQ